MKALESTKLSTLQISTPNITLHRGLKALLGNLDNVQNSRTKYSNDLATVITALKREFRTGAFIISLANASTQGIISTKYDFCVFSGKFRVVSQIPQRVQHSRF